jgi:hypothetical protein
MSLDIYFYTRVNISPNRSTKILFDETSILEYDIIKDYKFAFNLTHNLTEMASAAKVYEALWRPYRLLGYADAEEFQMDIPAFTVIPALREGQKILESNKEELIQNYSPKNGWGTYDQLYKTVCNYRITCEKFPNLFIEVSR